MKLVLSPRSFEDLKQNLEVCDILFLQHQVYLMHQNTEKALNLFEQLVQIRKIHLTVMEKLLLPVFKETTKIPEGAKPLYFEREKKQILKYLEKYIRKLGNIVLHSERFDIVALFEEYAWLKDLLDHHDAREKAFLFPVLDSRRQEDKIELLTNVASLLSVMQRIQL